MFDPFSQQGAGELNVLKRHLQSTVLTLLDRNTSQREIHRLTGVDRKTIRRYQALRAGAEANSPGEVTTGSVSADGQIPPPRPPAFGTSEATVTSSLARSACEAHRTWIEEQVRLKRNAQAIYQDLVDQFGFPSSYQSVKSGLCAGCGTLILSSLIVLSSSPARKLRSTMARARRRLIRRAGGTVVPACS
ncbi:hypothetical protein ACVIHB_001648 [Bradyrhizobium liaoningense]